MATQLESVVAPQADEHELIFDQFRRWGYLAADLDPLGYEGKTWLKPQPVPELDIQGQAAERARKIYCGAIGAEFMHISDARRRRWVRQRMEAAAGVHLRRELQLQMLERLVRAEIFEQMLQSRYLGTKRFSLEGLSSLIPLLDEVLAVAIEHRSQQVVMAMSHRGRLNVMVNIVGRPPADIFARFEDVDPRSVLGGGDVKYHVGATGEYVLSSAERDGNGRRVRIHLVSNPSHLEAVDPVAMGRVYAKQKRAGQDGERAILPVIMHGDAAFAGQGVVAETLDFSGIQGFSVGGAVHVVVNNLIGFTATPPELHTSRFATDVARRLEVPIFHVNAEDPEAVLRVARMATEYRYTFGTDVVIDLIGYRRHGHSEVDDPTVTQPLLYRRIKEHPPTFQIYAQRTGLDAAPIVEGVRGEYQQALSTATAMTKKPVLATMPDYWSKFRGGCWKPEFEVNTGIAREELQRLAAPLTSTPESFHVHPKIKRLLQQRAEMGKGTRPLDYGMAEALAFASLVSQGIPVRLTGQDTRRGTFNQRHAVLIDTEDESEYIPLHHITGEQAWCEIYNSVLSEAGVMGFEYGFSRDFPEALVLWEAQFGDFANGAQIIIDQFIAAAEDKWGLLSGLVLLLPHGYEGQGPEHSSARIERFLQLAARDNIQIAQPSNAAQYFHLLRRQALRSWRKPLIVFTPKSMLRHPDAASPLQDFSYERFFSVLADESATAAERILLCTGKIGHELREKRKNEGDTRTAILFVEQLYPFPEREIAIAIERYANAREIVWVQEEPKNMGALSYVMPRLRRIAKARGLPVRSVKRSASSSPATGSAAAHELEQKALLALAFS
jgi:2-oxoglutarate dehydrogenase E1 component